MSEGGFGENCIITIYMFGIQRLCRFTDLLCNTLGVLLLSEIVCIQNTVITRHASLIYYIFGIYVIFFVCHMKLFI